MSHKISVFLPNSSVSIKSTAADVAGYVTRTSGGATIRNCFSAPTLEGTRTGAFVGDIWGTPTQVYENCIAVGYPFQDKGYGEIKAINCYGTVTELATVSGNLEKLDANSMQGVSAKTNMQTAAYLKTDRSYLHQAAERKTEIPSM